MRFWDQKVHFLVLKVHLELIAIQAFKTIELVPLVAPIIPQVLHVADGDVVGEASQVPQCLATHVQQVNEVLRRREHQHLQRSSQAPI